MRVWARPGHPYLAGAPLLMAHRGGSRLAPENTLAAFRQAVSVWRADVLEMDVRLTADGKVVVIHDATLDRTTDGSGLVAETPWSRIRSLDAGFRFVDLDGRPSFRDRGVGVPLFEAVLDAFPGVRLNVESKVPEAAGPLVEVIAAHDAAHRVLVAAEHEPARRDARGYPGPWGASRRDVVRFWTGLRLPFPARWSIPPVDAFQVPEVSGPFRVVTPSFVAAAHEANIPVHVWTVDDPADMRRLLAWGVDGIQTDRPDVLARVLTEVAGRPPLGRPPEAEERP